MNQDNKQLLFLSTTSFVAQMIISMINLSLVFYLRDYFSYSPSTIAIAISSFSISYVLFCIIGEKPTNNFSPRHTISVGLIGMGISIILFLFSKNYFFIILTLSIYGAFMALLWPHMETWYSRGREKKDLNKAISYFNLSWSLGTAISAIVCGVLTEINGVLPLIVGIIVFMILSLFVITLTSKLPYLKAVESEKQYKKSNNVIDESTPLRFLAWCAVILGYSFLGMLSNIFPLYAREVLFLNETRIGFLLWSRGLVSCFAFYFLGKMSFWHFKGSLIILSQTILAILSFISIFLSSYNSLFILFILFGVVFALIYMQSIFHGVSGSVNRTRRMIIHEVLLTGGMVLGSIGSGYIYEKINFQRVMIYFSIFMTIAIIFELIGALIYKIRNKE